MTRDEARELARLECDRLEVRKANVGHGLVEHYFPLRTSETEFTKKLLAGEGAPFSHLVSYFQENYNYTEARSFLAEQAAELVNMEKSKCA